MLLPLSNGSDESIAILRLCAGLDGRSPFCRMSMWRTLFRPPGIWDVGSDSVRARVAGAPRICSQNAGKARDVFGTVALVALWWLTLKPSNDRAWQPDVAETAWAEINGDDVTIHNVRNCDYGTETDFTTHWETRTVRLSQITGMDLAIV